MKNVIEGMVITQIQNNFRMSNMCFEPLEALQAKLLYAHGERDKNMILISLSALSYAKDEVDTSGWEDDPYGYLQSVSKTVICT